jgi:hypothetical protein
VMQQISLYPSLQIELFIETLYTITFWISHSACSFQEAIHKKAEKFAKEFWFTFLSSLNDESDELKDDVPGCFQYLNELFNPNPEDSGIKFVASMGTAFADSDVCQLRDNILLHTCLIRMIVSASKKRFFPIMDIVPIWINNSSRDERKIT